jgi:hypothetical protein
MGNTNYLTLISLTDLLKEGIDLIGLAQWIRLEELNKMVALLDQVIGGHVRITSSWPIFHLWTLYIETVEWVFFLKSEGYSQFQNVHD